MSRNERTIAFALAATAALAGAGCGGSSKPAASRTASAPAPGDATTAPAQAPHASAGAASSVALTAGGVTATLHAGTHRPRVGAPWPLRFTVTKGGAPARASVSYEYMLAGQVVARRSHYTFTGHFSDSFTWPASAVGYPLTLRAVIVAAGATLKLDYPVQVHR